MSRRIIPDILARINPFPDRPRFDVVAAAGQSVLPEIIKVTPVALESEISAPGLTSKSLEDPSPVPDRLGEGSKPTSRHGSSHSSHRSHNKSPLGIIRRYKVGAAALVVLIVGIALIQGASAYESASIARDQKAETKSIAADLPGKPVSGFNVTVPAAEFKSKLQAITHQPVTLTVGSYTEQVGSDSIKSWLQITANKQKTEYYIHLNEAAMDKSLLDLAGQYAKDPVNQVTVDEDGKKVVALAGQDGTWLNDPATLKTQASQTAKDVLSGNGGLKFNTPLATKPFKAVTPANFNKLIVVNVTAKKMWIFQNGKQLKSYLVSAGAPDTPTPIGEFHVYAKFTSQDMYGYGPGHQYYFQPAVPWVSYFYEGSAVHGVYWHPLSWFGAINSSHGCVGIPVNEAEWVFNWDSIGTPVITHT